ncbi:MAG: pyridoxal-phosphate dependent enzyme [Cyclobacteriaceae bacterium]
MSITLEDIRAASGRIDPYIHRTPVLSSSGINEIAGCSIYFKCENFQKVGAFKARGAINAVLSLSTEDLEKGITTHSSGNHAQAIALAAKIAGTKAYIVMPKNAPRVKIEAVKGYGAEIIFCESTLQARESTVEKVIRDKGALFIHPYNDERIITGQATASLELFEYLDHSNVSLDHLLAPVGGGGLLSGTALCSRFLKPDTQIIGCEPQGADDAFRSFHAGHLIPQTNPNTVSDGLRTSLGDKTFAIISKYVSDILLAGDKETLSAMKLIWQRMKILIEPSCAVPLAALLANREKFEGKTIGIILSGGNVDINPVLDGTSVRYE